MHGKGYKMKKLIIILISFTLFSCSAFKSDIPTELQQVYDDVNNIMRYDATAPKWTINPIEKDILGFEYRRGSCSNYSIMYMDKLNDLGYDSELIYGHVFVRVTMPDGTQYDLDSAKKWIEKKDKGLK